MSAILLSACLSQAPVPEKILQQALPKTTQLPNAWKGNSQVNKISSKKLTPAQNGWLQKINDPQLNAIVAESLANNLDLRKAASQVIIASQNVVIIGAQMLPQVSVNAGKTWIHDFGESTVYKSNQIAGSASWELDIWGRLRAEKASAQASYEATALDFAYARQSLVATTVKSWYAVVEAYRLLQLAEQSKNLYGELLQLVKVREAAGKVSGFDVAQAQASFDSSLTVYQLANKNYADARRNLELLLGRYPAATIQTASYLKNLPAVIAPDTPAAILTRRPDIVAAEKQVISAFRLNESDRLALLPSVSLNLDVGRYNDGIFDLLKLDPWLARGAIGTSLPIYEGGALMATIKISDEQQKQAVANYGSVVLAAMDEGESGLSNEYFYNQSIITAEKALTQRNVSVNLAKIRYKAGASDILTVLQLQTLQIESESQTIQLRFARLTNWINLNLALGESFDAQPMIAATTQGEK